MFRTALVAAVLVAAVAASTAQAAADPVARRQTAQLQRSVGALGARLGSVENRVGALDQELSQFQDFTICGLILGNDVDQLFFRVISLLVGNPDPGVRPANDNGACSRAGITRNPPTYAARMSRADVLFDSVNVLLVGEAVEQYTP